MRRQRRGQLGNRKRQHVRRALEVVPEHDRQQAQERQQAAGQREQEKLDRGVAPVFAPPDADR